MYDLTGGNAYFSGKPWHMDARYHLFRRCVCHQKRDVNGADYLLKSDGTVVQVSTGLAEMSQAGLLEKVLLS